MTLLMTHDDVAHDDVTHEAWRDRLPLIDRATRAAELAAIFDRLCRRFSSEHRCATALRAVPGTAHPEILATATARVSPRSIRRSSTSPARQSIP
jgi:hypothetical protein